MQFLPPKTVRRSPFPAETVPCVKCGKQFWAMWMKTEENICPKCYEKYYAGKEKRK